MIEELNPKFIIEEGNLILSRCIYHNELVTEKDKVQGGGWFKLEDKTFTFYGSSDEFGQASLEDIQKAVSEDKVYTNYTCSYSIAKKHKFLYEEYGEITELN